MSLRDEEIYTPELAHADAISRGAKCGECPLYGQRRGPVKGDIREKAPIAIVGEGPGGRETQLGKVFIGPSGEVLNEALALGGVDRDDVTVVNVLECQPPEELDTYLTRLRKKTQRSPIDCCRPRLQHDLDKSNSPLLLAVGGKALEELKKYVGVLPKAVQVTGISDQHGAPAQLTDGRILCSSLHPAFALRERESIPEVIRDIKRAAEISKRRNKINWTIPNHVVPISKEQALAWIFKFRHSGLPLSLDIETDSIDIFTCRIKCINMAQKPMTGEEELVVVPILRGDGTPYWPPEEQIEVQAALRDLIDNSFLILQNGVFDTNVLTRLAYRTAIPPVVRCIDVKNGIEVWAHDESWFDLMVADHCTKSSTLGHDLGAIARRYTEAPIWKPLIDHKSSGKEGDSDLWYYGAQDVLVPVRVEPIVREAVVEAQNETALAIDTALQPIGREMTNLGLIIDERERGRLSLGFNELTTTMEAKFQELVGKDINPRAPGQVGEWLFGDLGLIPTLNTQGKPWKSGDDGSTSASALMHLIEQGLEPRVREAVEALLQYKACETIRNRYIDGLETRYDRYPELSKEKTPAVVYLGKELLPPRAEFSSVHANWRAAMLPTGRWASSPNVQNWPARAWALATNERDGKGNPKATNLRRLVVAAPGHKLVGMDFDQIELRIYLALTKDRILLDALRDGKDPHTLNLATLLAPTLDAVDATYTQLVGLKTTDPDRLKYLRTLAKKWHFACCYGATENKIYQILFTDRDKSTNERTFKTDFDRSRAKLWFRRYHKAHPEIRQYHWELEQHLKLYHYVESLLHHRKRHFPDGIASDNAWINHPFQTTAGDVVNNTTLRVYESIPHYKWSKYTGPLLQVHDQLVWQVPEEHAEETAALMAKCAKHIINGIEFTGTPVISNDWARQG